MPFVNSAGIGVNNFYGPRDTGGSVGEEHSQNSIRVLNIQITPDFLNGTYVPPVVFPKGAKVLRYTLRVDEAFTLGGTSPTVIIGGTAPATNGVVLSQAELQAVGSKTPASVGTGTWATTSATGATAAEKVTKTLGGTAPTVTAGAGKAILTIEFSARSRQ